MLQSCNLHIGTLPPASTNELPQDSSAQLAKLHAGLLNINLEMLNSFSTFDNARFASKIAQELNLSLSPISPSKVLEAVGLWRKRGLVRLPPRIETPTKVSSQRPLEGKCCIVTGASSGIGSAIASALAENGARVCLAGRRMDRLSQLKDLLINKERHFSQLRKEGSAASFATDISTGVDESSFDADGLSSTWKSDNVVDEVRRLPVPPQTRSALAFQCDVTKLQQVQELVAFATGGETGFGAPIDIFVNNAGVMHYTFLKNLHTDQWEKEVDVNIKGVLNGVAAVLPGMLQKKTGHIVTISSDAGRKVFPGLSVYSGTKHFVEAFSKGLRLETAETGIKV